MDVIDWFMLYGFIVGCAACVVVLFTDSSKLIKIMFGLCALFNLGFGIDLAITFFMYAE